MNRSIKSLHELYNKVYCAHFALLPCTGTKKHTYLCSRVWYVPHTHNPFSEKCDHFCPTEQLPFYGMKNFHGNFNWHMIHIFGYFIEVFYDNYVLK